MIGVKMCPTRPLRLEVDLNRCVCLLGYADVATRSPPISLHSKDMEHKK